MITVGSVEALVVVNPSVEIIIKYAFIFVINSVINYLISSTLLLSALQSRALVPSSKSTLQMISVYGL